MAEGEGKPPLSWIDYEESKAREYSACGGGLGA